MSPISPGIRPFSAPGERWMLKAFRKLKSLAIGNELQYLGFFFNRQYPLGAADKAILAQ
jgi:hypothetical protein